MKVISLLCCIVFTISSAGAAERDPLNSYSCEMPEHVSKEYLQGKDMDPCYRCYEDLYAKYDQLYGYTLEIKRQNEELCRQHEELCSTCETLLKERGDLLKNRDWLFGLLEKVTSV